MDRLEGLSPGLKNDKVMGKSRLRSSEASRYHLFLRQAESDYETFLHVFIPSAFAAQSLGTRTKNLAAEPGLSIRSAGTDVYGIGYRCGYLPKEDFCVATFPGRRAFPSDFDIFPQFGHGLLGRLRAALRLHYMASRSNGYSIIVPSKETRTLDRVVVRAANP